MKLILAAIFLGALALLWLWKRLPHDGFEESDPEYREWFEVWETVAA